MQGSCKVHDMLCTILHNTAGDCLQTVTQGTAVLAYASISIKAAAFMCLGTSRCLLMLVNVDFLDQYKCRR